MLDLAVRDVHSQDTLVVYPLIQRLKYRADSVSLGLRSALLSRGISEISRGGPLLRRCTCGVVWCGVVWCGVVWCGVVWCAEVTVTKRQWPG